MINILTRREHNQQPPTLDQHLTVYLLTTGVEASACVQLYRHTCMDACYRCEDTNIIRKDRPVRNCNMTANIYNPDPQSATKNKKKKMRKNKKQIKSNPEQIFLDTKYEDVDASGILTLDNEPTNAKFYTDRLLLWKDATLNYYMDLHERGVHQHRPKWQTNSGYTRHTRQSVGRR